MNVLLSIKPEFAEKIFNGEKKYEYRKAIFKNSNAKRIFIYASSPIKQIIGEITFDDILCDAPDKIWAKTSFDSGISKDYFFEYFANREKGYAIKIKKTLRYSEPINPYDSMPNFRAPQSFMYCDDPC